ncbi:bifunctional phosphoribosylaminoimidazolecarboxamide formyltransferase/IMP cyclohydrolase [Oxyplasma meridianum]|uniref:Bifunctional phosphoribosylaminoimidazolecarboxamide formyltransferase/IMP cyclohydrolase n=1 Tax=Oxyplasma meridianum TaxID=3073602 RepID=A0AAX4NDK7_9ARCH
MRALFSVYDKSGIEQFLSRSRKYIEEVYATGGTFKFLLEKGFDVKNTEDITGFQELLNGRVKTLHPNLFAGILSTRDETSNKDLKSYGIKEFDLVVSNLYPFEEASKTGNIHNMIENIDIGGVSLLRAAAKNFQYVTVASSVNDYDLISNDLINFGKVSLETRKLLAMRAFSRVASYDISIYNSMFRTLFHREPNTLFAKGLNGRELRYGENPDQRGYVYTDGTKLGIANSEQIQGKELSYNNLLDANSAYETALEFDRTVVVVMKHNTPCGVCQNDQLATAMERAVNADKESAYGSVIAMNREMTADAAAKISKLFVEVIVAPSYSSEALNILAKKKNLRVLKVNMDRDRSLRLRSISNGFLVQSPLTAHFEKLELQSGSPCSKETLDDLLFSWKVVTHCRSNAIVLAKDLVTTGIGAGQTSRIEALKIAVERSGGKSSGSVLASDAFFPFEDNVELAGKSGISAIIQPGGSIRDPEVISKASDLGISMYFTGKRVFLH